ncbi:MAG TPA: NAD(P)H-quinone oxidoreductase [Pyrinomonadaceae bacterium]|nr:NAD(P)H-quinone oxidoreductase [Pyrinomonadaceae bacterium]
MYIARFGPGLDLELRDMPDPPAPAGSNVVVKVAAAGLNRADLLQARGRYPPPAGYSPNIPGLEFAGIVDQVGRGVTRWSVGDRVMGITAGEAQAERLSIDETLLMRVPDNLTLVEAAAVPEAFITAHDALFTLAALGAGESVLIHAVGSGVGLAALQMARAAGAVTLGTSRTMDKLERCTQFGLDAAISSAEEVHFAELANEKTYEKGVDVILDLVGAAYFAQNLESLAPKGRLVLVGLTSGAITEFDLGVAMRKRLRILGTVLRTRTLVEKAAATRAFAEEMLPLFETGRLRPNLDRIFGADEAAEAYKYLESNESFGKVVLEF